MNPIENNTTDDYQGFLLCDDTPLGSSNRPLCGGQLAFSSPLLPPPSHQKRGAERLTQWEKGHLLSGTFLTAACLSMSIYTETLHVNVCEGEKCVVEELFITGFCLKIHNPFHSSSAIFLPF